MNKELMELLLKIEYLNTEDLEKVGSWVEHNLDKRKSKSSDTSICSNQHRD